MSTSPEASKALEYLAELKRGQEKVLLSGAFNRIGEYKAACAVLRNLDRLAENITKIFEGKEAQEEGGENGLAPMPEEGNKK